MPLLPCCGRRAARSVQLVDEQDGARTKRRLSGNTKSLLVMFFLFTTITAAQWVAGLMAHSLALQADCASMAVDALSYLGNMVAECRTDQRSRARLELGMSAFSLLLLAWFTLLFMAKAVNSVAIAESAIAEGAEGDDAEAVDPDIVLGFAMLGILFDVASLVGFRVWSGAPAASPSPSSDADGDGTNVGGSGAATTEGEGDGEAEGDGGAPRRGLWLRRGCVAAWRTLRRCCCSAGPANINMRAAPAANNRRPPPRNLLARRAGALRPFCGRPNHPCIRLRSGPTALLALRRLSALLHVLSDFARSTTTFIEGVLLVTHPELDGAAVDGWSALIVCLLISFGLVGGVGKWVLEFSAFLRDPEGAGAGDGGASPHRELHAHAAGACSRHLDSRGKRVPGGGVGKARRLSQAEPGVDMETLSNVE